jgi:hypothetical protein
MVIRLTNEHFSRLVVGVEDPAATIDLVRKAMRG